jgi:hypothetical protein
MSRRFRSSAGFSLIELVISLAVTVIVMVAMLTLFDRSARMSKAENAVTDAQQNARYASYQLVREARMAGAGAYPASVTVGGSVRQLGVSLSLGSTVWGTGSSYDTSNDIANDIFVGGTHHVRLGTDLLHVRGVILNAVYDLGTASWVPPSPGGTTATLKIEPCTKYNDPAASPSDACYPNGTNDMSYFPSDPSAPQPAVVPTSISTGTEVQLTLDVGDSTSPNSTYAQTISPGGAFPTGLANPSRGGILDDRVFFVDDGTASGADCRPATQNQVPGPCHPQLAVADWATGDTSATPFSTATVTPIADDIEDLQVAYGLDYYDLTTGSGSLSAPAPTRLDPVTGQPLSYPSDGSLSIVNAGNFGTYVTAARGSTTPASGQDPTVSTTADGDEWIWNVPGEPASGTFDRTSDLSRLRAIEVAILAKGSNPDPNYQGPNALAWLLMDSAAPTVSQIMKTAGGTAAPKAFHRRVVEVRMDFRNFNLQ